MGSQVCMADGRASAESSVLCLDNKSSDLNLHPITFRHAGKRLKWIMEFESLQKNVKETIGLQCKWSSPGGTARKFTSYNFDFSLTRRCYIPGK